MKALLTRGTGVASRAIQVRLQERWSHGVILDRHDPGLILDSTLTHGGVKARSLHQALRNVSAVVELWIPVPDETAAAEFAWQCVRDEVPYDIEALWGFTVGSRHWHDASSLYCFEYIGAAARAGGIPDFDGLRMVTAEDLISVAYKRGSVTECKLSVVPELYSWPEIQRI